MDVLEKWGSGPIGIPHALKSHIIVPQTSAVHSEQWHWNFSQVKDYGNKINGGFVNIEMSRVIKDFENSRSVAEHLSRGQIVHFICLGVRPQTLVTKSILREKFRVFNNNILSI